MLPLRFSLQWKIAGALLLLFVLVAALAPVFWLWPDRGRILSLVDGTDKWAHGITFAVLAVWFAGQYAKRSYWKVAIGLILFGMIIEACQRMVAYRTADWFDVAANVAGIIVGLLIAVAGLGGWSQRFENRYSRHAGEADSG